MGDPAIDEIIARTRRHFSDLLSEDANPLEVALALMDNSSIGKAMYRAEFDELQIALSDCLKQQVASNYDGFNSSISIYHTLVNSVNDNHQQVQQIQEELQRVRQYIKDRRPVVREWKASSQKYKQDLEVLDIAEQLKHVADRFEELVSRKRFIEAHNCLKDALETIVSHNMLRYAPIVPIHDYIVQQQQGLAQLIEDEFAAHLYLKSPWTAQRWVYHAPAQHPQDLIQARITSEAATAESARALQAFLAHLKEPLELDPTAPVESNSFAYIRLLAEALGQIGRLDQALDAILSKVQVNVRRLVEKTIADFIKREKVSVESIASLPLDLVALIESVEYNQRLRLLEALANTLYSKLNAVLEGHRILYEIVKDRYRYNLLHVYSAIETEVAGLISSYIGAPIRGLGARSKSFGSDSRRSGPSKHFTKSEFPAPAFEFTPESMDPEILLQFEDLRLTMKKWVPGLELSSELETANFNPFADTHKESNLSVVAPANILNIRALALPTASFLQHLRNTLSGQEQTVQRIDKFLSLHLNNTFLPVLKSAVERQVDEIMEEDGSSVLREHELETQLPILETAFKSVELLAKLTRVFNTDTYYRANYADILIMIMEMQRDFFGSKITDGITPREGGSKAIQQLVTTPEFKEIHTKLYRDPLGSRDQLLLSLDSRLVKRELQFYLGRVYNAKAPKTRITLNDILDIDTFKLFTLLSTSIQWVLLKLRQLKKQVPQSNDQPSMESQVTYVRRWWALVDISTDTQTTGQDKEPHIVLCEQALERFNKIDETLQAYNRQILSLLRADLMCRIVYHFDEMALKRRFDTVDVNDHHDTEIELLQNNLTACHKLCLKYLLPSDRTFVFTGCAKLMNELFIIESKNIEGTVNENGVKKMLSNILSLQQVLKSIANEPRDVDFSRSIEFYDALRATPARALSNLKSNKSRLGEEDMVLFLQMKQREDIAKSREHSLVVGQFNEYMQQVRLHFAKAKPAAPAPGPAPASATTHP